MISRLFREYKEKTWPFFTGDEKYISSCFDQKEAKKWFEDNKHNFEEIEIVIPPKKPIKVRIPIKLDWEEDISFEERILSDIRIDPKIRTICNKILQEYKYCFWWHFVRKHWVWQKMNPKNMEILQLMKDVIMWFIRYEPIKLNYEVWKWAKKRKIEYDWDITEDFNDVTYFVWWKSHKTNIYWVFTRKLRKSMFTRYFKFYWDHEFQYFQRELDLNYWAINYLCSSRDSWKCSYENDLIRMYDWTQKMSKDIVIWDKLLSSDWFWYVTVTEKDEFFKECLEITLTNWMKKTVSTDHRVPTQDNYSRKWWELDIDQYKKAESINSTDMLATQLSVREFSNEWSYEEWAIVWYSLWDWCRSNWIDWDSKPWSIFICSSCERKTLRIKELSELMWYNNSCFIRDWVHYINILWSYWMKWEYSLNKHSYEKFIHPSIFWKSNNFKWWLIEWLFNTDWYFNNFRGIEYCSTSEELVRWIQQILQDLWILTSIRSKKIQSNYKSTKDIARYLDITSMNSLRTIFENIRFSNKKNYEILKAHCNREIEYERQSLYTTPLCSFVECEVKPIQWNQTIKWRKRQYFYWDYRKPRYNYSRQKLESYWLEHRWIYWWNKPKKIENVWKKKVIHISVTWDSCFWVNWILTHNSIVWLREACLPLFKSKTSLREFADPANLKSHFFVKANNVIDNMSAKIKEFFYNLLVKTYKLDELAAQQIVERKGSEWKFILHQDEWDRTMEFVSELATSKRWERSWRAVLDESNYLKNFDEVSEFATKSGAQSVFYISTISQDSKNSKFYNWWVKALMKNKELMAIDEVLHYIRTKYWFNKIKCKEDYKEMALNWTLDNARAEYFKLRPSWWQKVTLDEVEYLTEEEKEVKVQWSIDSVTGYDWMLAEYYCELSPETPVIRYKPNIIDFENVPRQFDKIYAWYDVADSYDDPALIIWWVYDKKLYIIEEHDLPKLISERYEKINEILWFREKRSWLRPSLIIDIWNGWSTVFMHTAENVKYCDMAIKARSGTSEKIWNTQWISFYQVWTETLVKTIVNNEMIWADRLFFSSMLSTDSETWLFNQLDNYIQDSKWTYKGKWHKHDDKVTALLYLTYYVYMEEIKWEKTYNQKNDVDILNEYTKKLQEKTMLMNRPAKKKTLWSIW